MTERTMPQKPPTEPSSYVLHDNAENTTIRAFYCACGSPCCDHRVLRIEITDNGEQTEGTQVLYGAAARTIWNNLDDKAFRALGSPRRGVHHKLTDE